MTGGLIFSIVAALIAGLGGPKLTFLMDMRDVLLLVFFSTIGLSAKLSRLKSGGKALAVLVDLAPAVVVALQLVLLSKVAPRSRIQLHFHSDSPELVVFAVTIKEPLA